MEFRPAVLPDLPDVTELARQAYQIYVPRMDREPAPMSADYGPAIRAGQVHVVVDEHRVVGMIVLVAGEDWLQIDNVAVHPDHQDRGIGTRLLRFAELEALRSGVLEIRLHTNEQMTENIAFYAEHGYGETHRAEQDGYRRVFFAKPMPAGIAGLVHRFYALMWNLWDDDAVDEVLAEDFTFHDSLGAEATGRDGWRRYRDSIRIGAPDFHNELVDLIAYGDRAAARLVFTGHHHGRLADIEPTGREFRYAGAAFFTERDGRISSAWTISDLGSLRRQLS